MANNKSSVVKYVYIHIIFRLVNNYRDKPDYDMTFGFQDKTETKNSNVFSFFKCVKRTLNKKSFDNRTEELSIAEWLCRLL
jgi:hypothetical protein